MFRRLIPQGRAQHPKDFDSSALDGFLKRAGIRVGGMRAPGILINLGVARAEGRNLRMNNAGILLFAKDPFKFIPQSGVTGVLFRDTDGTDVIDRKDRVLAASVGKTSLHGVGAGILRALGHSGRGRRPGHGLRARASAFL